MGKKVWAMFFSGTGTTEKVVTAISADIAAATGYEMETFNFTQPKNRLIPK